MKIDSVHAEFMSGNAVSSTTSSHSIVSRDASGDIAVAGVSIVGNSGTLFRYGDGTSNVYGGCDLNEPWFGTSSDNDLRLVTNGSERMRIDNTGNVGIGTDSPSSLLDVFNSSHYTGYRECAYFRVSNDATHTNWTRMILGQVSTSNCFIDITDQANTKGNLMLQPYGGNVGIGTTSPTSMLELAGNSGGSVITLKRTNASNGGAKGGIRFTENTNGYNVSTIACLGDGSNTSGALCFYTKASSTATGPYLDPADERMRISSGGNVGIGTSSPYGKLGIYTGSTATAGLTIDRHTSGTYRSELYQESDGLAIKVGDGTNTPTENMRITSSTTATPGKLTVGSGTASGSQMFVYAAGDGSTTAHTDLHVVPNGQMIMYGTRPWITTTNAQGTFDRQCYISLHASGHQPAIEWARNNGQGTNQRNWLLRQEGDDYLHLWHYNGSTWTVPFVFNKDGKLGVGTSSPRALLDVSGPVGVPAILTSGAGSSEGDIAVLSGEAMQIGHWDNATTTFTNRIHITSGGNVGIGTDSPDEKLEVRGHVKISDNDTSAFHLDKWGTIRRNWYDSNHNTNHGSGLHFTDLAIFPTDRAGSYSNGGVTFGTSSYPWSAVHTNTLETYSTATIRGHIHVAPATNTVNSPYTTGIDVYNSGTGDATLALRVKDSTAGDPFIAFDISSEYGWSLGVDNNDSNKFKLARTWNNINSSTAVTVTTDNWVGIGTTNPQAALHVEGAKYGSLGNYNSYYSKSRTNNGTWATAHQPGTATFNWGIYAHYYIGTGFGFVHSSSSFSASDERIKKNIVDADDAECLETLRLLKPKKYQYRDVIKRGEAPVWGFIAQEVKEALPYATKFIQDVIPNIYELANVSSSNVITFTDFNTSNLESNATTLIRVTGIDDEDHDIHLAEIIDEHTIRVEEDLSAWTGSVDETGNVVAGNQLFVYGQQVDDFVYIQKEAIWSVTTAALQEVDRQLQAEKARNDALERRVEELESMVSIIKLNMTWPDA